MTLFTDAPPPRPPTPPHTRHSHTRYSARATRPAERTLSRSGKAFPNRVKTPKYVWCYTRATEHAHNDAAA